MFTTKATRKSFTTADGVGLSYLEAGEGRPFVMIPGWSQTALQWHDQIDAFAQTHRVIAMDMRGHGASEKPEYGYRVYRLAKDVRELMEALDLSDAVLMGHSMGCSVIWALYDLFSADRIGKLVLVDQSALLADTALLSDEARAQAGAIFTPEAAVDVVSALRGENAKEATAGFVGGMFTPDADREIVETSVALNYDFPRRHAGTLVFDHVFNDWRDVMARITVPTLCIDGESSLVPTSTMRWQASVIPNARVEIFATEEGGAHFMFMENPQKFNALVAEFLAG
ncbi:MAG: alpha/beta hydrolase [Pseudomonadota bacterium]